MKQAQTFVYRLDITYPPGSQNGSGYRPYHWDSILQSLPRARRWRARRTGFRWPRERLYLSSSSAYRQAGWLTFLGAAVTVRRSDPVTWTVAEMNRIENLLEEPS